MVENVISYYEPPIPPTATLGRHRFWANFPIPPMTDALAGPYISNVRIRPPIIKGGRHGSRPFNLEVAQKAYGMKPVSGTLKQQGQWLRNCLDPRIGRHLLDHARNRGPNPVSLLDFLDETSLDTSANEPSGPAGSGQVGGRPGQYPTPYPRAPRPGGDIGVPKTPGRGKWRPRARRAASYSPGPPLPAVGAARTTAPTCRPYSNYSSPAGTGKPAPPGPGMNN